MKIVDNLQVFIDDIHIRYEDTIHNLSFGITLERIHMQSVDSNWKNVMIDIGQQEMHKLLNINNFTVYMNPSADPIYYTYTDDFVDKMGQYIYRENEEPVKKNFYIVTPLNGIMKLNVNMNDKNISRAKAIVSIEVNNFGIEIDSNQYNGALSVSQFVQSYFLGFKFLKFKPPSTVLPVDDPEAWWKYALKSQLKSVRKNINKWKWEHFSARINARSDYIAIYKKKKIKQVKLVAKRKKSWTN